jgi:hypothetical protein
MYKKKKKNLKKKDREFFVCNIKVKIVLNVL